MCSPLGAACVPHYRRDPIAERARECACLCGCRFGSFLLCTTTTSFNRTTRLSFFFAKNHLLRAHRPQPTRAVIRSI